MKSRSLFHTLAEGTVLVAWMIAAYVAHDALSRGDAEVGERTRSPAVRPAAEAASVPAGGNLAGVALSLAPAQKV